MNNTTKQFEFLDLVSLGSAGLGFWNFILNNQQLSNDDLFTKLVNELKKDINEDNNRIVKELSDKLDYFIEKMEGGGPMETYRDIMCKIGERNETYEQMIEYKIVMEELMHELEKHDPNLYNKTISKLEEIAYHIPLEKAKHIVMNMKPYGEHWSYEKIKDFMQTKGIVGKCEEYYLVMNMMYSDYYDVATNFGHQSDPEFYFELAHSFINDVDGKKFKVQRYFL